MPGKRYDRQFKLSAARLVLEGEIPVKGLSDQLNVPCCTLRRWAAEYEADGEDAFPGSGNPVANKDHEILKLKKENEELRKEVAILKNSGPSRGKPKREVRVREDRRAWDERQEGMRGAGRQQGRILCLPEPPQIIEANSPRGAGAVRRGHLLRQQSQIRVEADRRRASQDRHRRERQDRAAHDGEERAGILQGPKKHRRGGKASDKGANVLNGEFSVKKRNSVWCGDIACIPTREGWLYLATYLDLLSRKIVGWQVPPHQRESGNRRPWQRCEQGKSGRRAHGSHG